MITRNVYDSLSTKPPLNPISKSDIGVDGHPFEIDGVTYINLTMKTENKETFVIEYEPVIVTSKNNMCIFGIKSEEKFKKCVRNESNHTLEYHTENDRTVSVKFYRQSENYKTAYIKEAKTAVIPQNYEILVKVKIDREFLKETRPPYCVSKSTESEIDIPEMKFENVDKVSKFHVENISWSSLKLKKGDILREISKVYKDSLELSSPVKILKTDICVEKLNVGELHENERDIFYNIVNKSKHEIQKCPDKKAANLPIEHKILLSDNVPVSSNPRRLPQVLREEIDSQITELREKEFIETFYSPYAAPLVPVLKKDGSIRMCCDFRLLNSKAIPAKYPIPHKDDILMEFRDSKIFCVIDLKSAYHQILITKEDREKTACVTQDYKFQ